MGTTIKQKLNSIDAGIKISKMLSEFNLTTKKEIENIQTIIQSENIVQEQGSSLLLIFHNLKNTIDKNNEINTETIEKLDNLKKSVYDYSNVNLIIGELSRNREKKKEQYVSSASSVVVETDGAVSSSKTGILEKIDREILSSAIGAMTSYDGTYYSAIKGVITTIFIATGIELKNDIVKDNVNYYQKLKKNINEIFKKGKNNPKIANVLKKYKIESKVNKGVDWVFKQKIVREFIISKFYEQEIQKAGINIKLKSELTAYSIILKLIIGKSNPMLLPILTLQRVVRPEILFEEIKSAKAVFKNKVLKNDFENKYSHMEGKVILNLAEAICEHLEINDESEQKNIIIKLQGKSRSEVLQEAIKILKNYKKFER